MSSALIYGKKLAAILLACIFAFSLGTVYADKGKKPASAGPKTSEEARNTSSAKNYSTKVILAWNEDILETVYASCRYGLNSGGTENAQKALSLLVTTDVHGYWDRLNEAVKYLNAVPSLDCGCCLGDILYSDFTDDADGYNEAVKSSDKPWFTVIGNHDCGNSYDPNLTGTTKEVVRKLITPNAKKAGQKKLTVPYYYYDWDEYGIRLIVLYNYGSPYDSKEHDALVMSRGTECYDQKQINWLISTLNSTPEGYAVVIMQHGQPEKSLRVDCNFSQPSIVPTGNGTGCYKRASIKGAIVDAWIHGTALSKTYKPEGRYSDILPEIRVEADFTARGTGEFICYLTGHEHADIVARLKEYPEQITICFAATAGGDYQNEWSDLPRVAGDRSEDAITVVSFDTYLKRINTVRIGSSKTIYMVDRTMVSIPYMYE